MSNTDFNGSFKIISPVLVGIDIKKVVDQFNNISGIADVMPILNGNFLQGFSQLEEINGFFSIPMYSKLNSCAMKLLSFTTLKK